MSKGLLELKKAFPAFRPAASVVIGGQVRRGVEDMLDAFDGGMIYAFEPDRQEHASLHGDYGQSDRVVLERRGLGSKSGTVYMTRRGITETVGNPDDKQAGVQTLKVERGDEYFRAEGIDSIGLLVTACREWDLEVLGGLGGYLTAGRISFIQMRCGFTLSGSICRVQDALELLLPIGYQVISIFSSSRLKVGEVRGPAIGSAEFLFAHAAAVAAVARD